VDPITVIVSALALGAASGVKATASSAVQDAYRAVKELIARHYKSVDVRPVEQRPDSAAKRDSLAEDLADAGAGTNAELLAAARLLVSQVTAHDAAVGAAVGIDLERVAAAALRIGNVDAEGTGVRVRDGKFTGDIEIGDVRAGRRRPADP
jgi:hypothetical protein